MFKVDQNYMRRDRDGSLDGRLDMSNHRISGLADPTDADDAVTRRYVASRFQDSVMKFKIKRVSWMPFKIYLISPATAAIVLFLLSYTQEAR